MLFLLKISSRCQKTVYFWSWDEEREEGDDGVCEDKPRGGMFLELFGLDQNTKTDFFHEQTGMSEKAQKKR